MEDADFIFRHFRDPGVTQYLLDEPPLADYAQAQAMIHFYLGPEGKTYNRWGIVRNSDNRLIGTRGYHKWMKAHFRVEIGFNLCPDCWGQGYMAEALQAMIRNGFERMKLNRVNALVYVGDGRSLRLLGKMGFKREGLLRDYFCLDGKSYDHFHLALLRREWEG